MALHSELEMAAAVAEHFKNCVREVRVGNWILDVVASERLHENSGRSERHKEERRTRV